ncbi:hypothetical protein E4U40_000727 [Claviceps sp. LM458 group G5]|nr:hypothetical protein E4U40_000727 [Claviceps sp. LM458 group G5]KAG6047922.1 hypothetical protein E4U39_007912 [Claviceps sp. Clav50 group G5]
MADLTASRFTPQNKSTHERLSTTTVGLVALSDFRKRRAEVLEQQEREAREAAISGTSTPDASSTNTPDNVGSDTAGGAGARRPLKKSKQQQLKQKQKKTAKKLLSFDEDDGDVNDDGSKDDLRKKDEGGDSGSNDGSATKSTTESPAGETETRKSPHPKVRANSAVGVIPRAVTKAALLKEATERETLRREFVAVQEAVKATEIAIPFIFYDGSNVTGGTVRVKKGDFVWVLLDKSRKVGAERRVGERGNPRRAWARVGVDDLMLVRDNIIIPHHYDFYYFIINECYGPEGRRIFEFSAEAPLKKQGAESESEPTRIQTGQLSTAATRAAAAKNLVDINTLEGASDEPVRTKVVDRRWYDRNKHIYPASTWREFDPEMDYTSEVRKDNGGNTYFFAK